MEDRIIKPGQHFLVLKYNTTIEPQCIELHQEIIKKDGFCWFGKVGKYPSKIILEKVLSEDNPILILFAKNKAHICSLEGVSFSKEKDSVPLYYEEKYIVPDIYFKLRSIEPMDISLVSDAVVCSSGKKLKDSLFRTMASFTLYQMAGERESLPTGKTVIIPDNDSANNKECKYQTAGKCGRKGFVNYKYECERPSSCSGCVK